MQCRSSVFSERWNADCFQTLCERFLVIDLEAELL